MRIVLFYHSLISDWNHGNAHFLRGVATELISRGHDVHIFEPEDAWSVQNLLKEHGQQSIRRFHTAYPNLTSTGYNLQSLDLDKALDHADLVIVHEWNEPELVSRIGRYKSRYGQYKLLFHDTHHRSLTDKDMAAYDLSNYDGVLAFGSVIRDLYLSRGWTGKAWTWHEAADTRVFRPMRNKRYDTDVIWIGNWGDDERTDEIKRYLLTPVKNLVLKASVHGVRYPQDAIKALAKAGIKYKGYLPNYDVPEAFSRAKATVHIPRGPYVQALPGIPTIRVFEALACAIPLVCAPWEDTEGLFTAGEDYLLARSSNQMQHYLKELIEDEDMARAIADHGLRTIIKRHTCSHRVDELLNIYASLEATR